MTPRTVAAPFIAPVAIQVTPRGVWSAVQLPPPSTVRSGRFACTCTDGSCIACYIAEDVAYERSLDV
jgi:hypothetical protein